MSCPWVVADGGRCAGHACAVPAAPVYETTERGTRYSIASHEGRHRCEHGYDGTWKKGIAQ